MITPEIHFAQEDLIKLLTMAQACRLLPKQPSPSTLWRWRTRGVTINGQRIRLACIRSGGQWLTSAAAVAEFLRQQTGAALAKSEYGVEERSETMLRRLVDAGLHNKDA